MMDVPLTVTALMRYGTSIFADREVRTWTGDTSRGQTYGQTGARAAKLAGALRSLGVDGDQRVATLMWNNAEHLEAYLAIPSMGAVLHTLNLRLDPAQLGYIANHAADHAVIVDPSLVPLLAQVLAHAETIRHVLVTGPAGEVASHAAQLAGPGREVHSYEELLAGMPESFAWAEPDERSAAAMCYTSGTTGLPKGVVYSHRSAYLHSMGVCLGNTLGVSERDRVLPVVPMFHANAWGLPYASVMSGADLIMPDRFLQPEPLVKLIESERPTVAGAVPTIWNGLLQHIRANGGDISSLRLVACGGSAVPPTLMEAFEEELGVLILPAGGMKEDSPIRSVAQPATRHPRRSGMGLPGHPGPPGLRRRGTAGRGRRHRPATRRQGRGRGRGARPLGDRDLLQRRRPGEVPRRLAAHRRRRHHRPARLRDADRPGQGRHQVGWRMDFLHGAGERADGTPPGERGRGHWGSGRQVGRAAAGLRGAAARRLGDRRGAARLPGRTDAALAASRPVVVHRRGAQDRRGQVRQDEDPRQLRPWRLHGGRGTLTRCGVPC